jgi:hypothetical protein
MKKLMTVALVIFASAQTFAQKSTTTEEVTNKNSWLKAGLEASVPVGKTSDGSSFAAGVVLSGQWMVTKNFGLGVTSGYTHFFAKNDGEDGGIVPAGLLLRYYPMAKGFFVGTDVGYSFLTNAPSDVSGGFYVKPQVGYHNYSWNFYAFYNQVFLDKGYNDIQNVGVAATYNIRFNRK